MQWFMEDNVNEILKIPLLRKSKIDELIWHFEKKIYYVKSEYQLALKIKYPDKPSCQSKGFNH